MRRDGAAELEDDADDADVFDRAIALLPVVGQIGDHVGDVGCGGGGDDEVGEVVVFGGLAPVTRLSLVVTNWTGGSRWMRPPWSSMERRRRR